MGLQKNTAGQKWVVFAFNETDNTPVTGDAAQITGKVALDWGTRNAITDTNPTEQEDGYYVFDLTQGETNGDVLNIYPESSTGNVRVIGVPGTIFTVAPNFSALGIESDGDLTKVNAVDGQTPQTGDSFARIGVAGAGLTDIDLPNQTMDIIGDITGNLSGSVGSNLELGPAEVNAEVLDVLNVDTFAEPGQGNPATTTTLVEKIGYLYKKLINKVDSDGTTENIYNAAGAVVDQKVTWSDAAGTTTKGDMASGP